MVQASLMELVLSLVAYPDETEWLEFKESNSEAERIGRDISALANSAALLGREYGYRVWGIEDTTHELVGTSFTPQSAKAKGNQDLLIWLSRFLSQNAAYRFEETEHEGKRYVVLTIQAASGSPVYFDKAAYIRVGSSTTRLEPSSAQEVALWSKLQESAFENRTAESDVMPEEVGELLNVDAYFELLRIRKPGNLEGILAALAEQSLVKLQDNRRYAITNLGALLVAKRLAQFASLRKRPLRVIRFEGKGSFDILDDRTFDEGYATALGKAEDYILSVTPSWETQDGAFRRIQTAFPSRAIREFLSNMLIHQDLSDSTSGPLVCIYEDRIEFSNPGELLIPANRVLNAQPKTRNGALVEVMREMDLCEEGGTGWDLAVAACEASHLVAPKIVSSAELGTRVTLFSNRAYSHMTKQERMEATYWHSCLLYAQGASMGNLSLRERFGLDDSKKNMVAISRLIRECCVEGMIKAEDETVGAKYKRYIPAWA